ncbi:hypothetical protein AGOR_G00175430 [Albula goreensis]|uniref:Centrosome and spindle pole-associated protein 1 C-terminal domain-containing protein n=1 Tax=Albula goreensis TaxID=1534307 RepID=A0A8T3CXT9_9TELE|nr:hypothetical protein AGOR_G00175430 [Albula goreensis]
MEIRTDNELNAGLKESRSQSKWSSAKKVEMTSGLSLPLGEDYERKKQRLQEELRLDYRRYMAKGLIQGGRKKKVLNDDVPSVHAQGQSLPINERRSAKDRLRNERNKEYNQFLTGQEGPGRLTEDATKASQVQNKDRVGPAVPRPGIPSGRSAPATHERLPSRRDAATLTEARVGPGMGAQGQRGRKHWREGPEPASRRLVYSRWDDDLHDDYSEDELEFVDRRKPRPSQEPEYPERRSRRPQYRPDREMPQLRGRVVDDSDDCLETGHTLQRPKNANRAQWERRKAEVPITYEDDYKDGNRRTLSAAPNPKLQALGSARASERARSVGTKDRAEFATGLMIGAADEDQAMQMRKERYRLELQEQMAEQQRNKRKEKELELRVAATGAIDPEKKPDRIKEFGVVTRGYKGKRWDVPFRPGLGLDKLASDSAREHHEEPPADMENRPPPDRPRVAFQAPLLDSSTMAAAGSARAGLGGAAALNDDFHRGLSSTLGEIVTPRIAGAPPPPPPPPPTLPDAYRTPYDEAYYYYGSRNPLDPSLAYYIPVAGGVQSMAFRSQVPGVPQYIQPQMTNQTGAVLSGTGVGVFPTERPKQIKESVLSYQEALKQQMQERQERKRHEKEEKERYEAKLELEMRAYNPWGKGGAGAPIRDSRGNLITDLNQMHRVNEEAYLNPDSRGKRAAASIRRNIPSPGGEERASSSHRISGFSYAQMPGFAQGNPFTDVPTPQQLHEQDKYRDYLKQQIEEKRQKEAQERERLRLEEEREEKRLAEQRARIQREYEEEQERKRCKEREQNVQNEEQIRLLRERRKEEERKKREEEEKENDALRQQSERERQAQLQETPREPSPPIPVVQKRLASQHISRPSSTDSQQSSITLSDRSICVPPSPPVPARKNQLRAIEEHQGVVSELSTLRKQLRSEQRRLDRELLQTQREGLDSPLIARRRERSEVDVFDMARLRVQVPVRRNSKVLEPVNLKNIRDFNQLKYRDTESREEVRQTYPDPPVDDYSLELQQQALLREQQRRINRMKRREAAGYFDLSPQAQQTHDLHKSSAEGPLRGSLLESESAFIDSSGDTFPVLTENRARPEQTTRPPSEWGRVTKRIDYDNETAPFEDPVEPTGQLDTQSLRSADSLRVERIHDRNQRRIQRLEEMSSQAWTAGEVSSDDGYTLLQQDTLLDLGRRCSAETLATEPWMRPGTSETLKRFMAGETRRERLSSRGSLTHNWEGPSTYHG